MSSRMKIGAMPLMVGMLVLPISGMAAEGLNYGFIQADYINLDVDQAGENGLFRDDFDNGGGYGIKGSLPLSEMFFIYAGYSDTQADFTFIDDQGFFIPGDVDIHKFNIGLGLVLPMSAMTDLVLSGGYADLDYENFDFGGSDDPSINDLDEDDSDGYTADVKLRSQLSQNVEGSVGARYTDIENVDGVSLIANLEYEFTQNAGVNLSVDAGDELLSWGLGLRFSF